MGPVMDAAWKEQKFGRVTGGEIERCIQTFREAWSAQEEWSALAEDNEKWLESVSKLAAVPSWTVFYQDTFAELLAKVALVAGFSDAILKAADASSPATAIMDAVADIPDDVPEHPAAIPLAFAMVGNLEAIARYSQSINDLLASWRTSLDAEALAKAISVDSYLTTMPFVQAALRIGQLSGDDRVASDLFKALKGPHKGRLDNPELRWTEYLLREQGAFQSCSRNEICDLVVDHLRLYDVAGRKEDAKAALFSLFRSWQREAGIQNPRFGFSAKSR